LPSKFDIHEWSIMNEFVCSVRDVVVREDLLRAIHGRGAFRAFKDLAIRHGLETDWYRFKADAITEIVTRWLEANSIECVQDASGA
jgi:hypothetical protein